jgi:hypothetical protein
MQELLRSNDPVELSFAAHVLGEAGVDFLVVDTFTSAIEGSIGAIPRRILVPDEQLVKARMALGKTSLTIPD